MEYLKVKEGETFNCLVEGFYKNNNNIYAMLNEGEKKYLLNVTGNIILKRLFSKALEKSSLIGKRIGIKNLGKKQGKRYYMYELTVEGNKIEMLESISEDLVHEYLL